MPPSAEPVSRPRRIGRYIVYCFFAALTAYLVIMVLTSVLLSLYGTPPVAGSARLEGAQRDWCLRTLVTLRDELEHEVQLALRVPPRGDPQARFATWNARWMQRQVDGASRCPDEAAFERAHVRLVALHAAYVQSIEGLLKARSDLGPSLSDVMQLLENERATGP